ncbi:Tyrosinase-like protein orsC [Lachnellula cervina]|uniref:Tyrosinase-like protein orsC n=1 Tax=Lachnellula cervina TaxID=1316786 RepID=A0A7D8UJQ4_9HELO|nr:Tyrosinase-like protein orsC [Lachnellula cervina]
MSESQHPSAYLPLFTNMLLSPVLAIGSLVLAMPVTEFPQIDDLKPRCSKRRMRKEWGELTKRERIQYTNAVLCLQHLPSILDPKEVPGAKSRYDDFLAVHINQTQRIHMSGFFLPWHRVFVHLYEHALQHECNYSGTQPYWNWALYTNTLLTSPLFDGSPSSLSGNGNGNGTPNLTTLLPSPSSGGGAGCPSPPTPPTARFTYTPHCLTRHLNPTIATRYTSASAIQALICNTSDIAAFQARMSGVPGTDDMGVHGGGHFTLGGTGSDIFASPGDPAFWVHHGMVDRVWGIWQDLDVKNRQYAISGTKTFMNVPPSEDVALDDVMDWGVLGPVGGMRVRDAMVVGREPFCYGYTPQAAAFDKEFNVLATRLLVVHDTGRGGQDHVSELTGRQELDNPLLEVAEADVEARGDDAGLVETAVELDNDLSGSVVVDFLELADVAWGKKIVSMLRKIKR